MEIRAVAGASALVGNVDPTVDLEPSTVVAPVVGPAVVEPPVVEPSAWLPSAVGVSVAVGLLVLVAGRSVRRGPRRGHPRRR